MNEPAEVNIPLLRKAVEWAEVEAAKPWKLREWDQAQYRNTNPQYVGKALECGTCYCIAGYVAALVNADYAEGKWCGPDFDAPDVAAEALGIGRFDGSPDAGDHLFSDDNTIADVRRIAEDIAGERL